MRNGNNDSCPPYQELISGLLECKGELLGHLI